MHENEWRRGTCRPELKKRTEVVTYGHRDKHTGKKRSVHVQAPADFIKGPS